MTADDLDTARDRLRELRAQVEAERRDGTLGAAHNRKSGSARGDRQLRNRRGRRRAAQRNRSA